MWTGKGGLQIVHVRSVQLDPEGLDGPCGLFQGGISGKSTWLLVRKSQKCPVINMFFCFAVNSEFGNKIIQIGHTYSIVLIRFLLFTRGSWPIIKNLPPYIIVLQNLL